MEVPFIRKGFHFLVSLYYHVYFTMAGHCDIELFDHTANEICVNQM